MTKYLFTNNATSRMAVDHDEHATSILVFPGEGDRFPNPNAASDTISMITLEDRRSGQIEICRCIERNGDLLLVERAQEGTIAQYFYAGATVSNRVTAATVTGLYQFSYTKEEADDLFVNIDGDTMTGALILQPDEPTEMYEAVYKRYVDNLISLRAPAALATAATLTYIATAGQTTFNLSTIDIYGNKYVLNQSGGEEPLDLHVNGVRQVWDTATVDGDYTADPTQNTVTVLSALPAGTTVQIDVYTPRDRLVPGSVNVNVLAPIAPTGSATAFKLTRADDGQPISVIKSEEVLMYVNGVPQVPYVDYTVTYDNLAFSVAPEADARVWGVWFQPSGASAQAGNVNAPASPQDLYRNVYAWDPANRVLGWQDARPLHQIVADAAARTALVANRDITIGSLVTQADTADTWIFTGTRGAPSVQLVPKPVFAAADGRWTLDTTNPSVIVIKPNHASTWNVDDVFEFELLLDGITKKVYVPLVGTVLGDGLKLDDYLQVVDPSKAKVAFSTDIGSTFNTSCTVVPPAVFQIVAIRSTRTSYPLLVGETILVGPETHYGIEFVNPIMPVGSTYSVTLDNVNFAYTVQAGDTLTMVATAIKDAIPVGHPGWTVSLDGTVLSVDANVLVAYGRTDTIVNANVPGPVENPTWHVYNPAPLRRDILQRLELNPKTGEPIWVDARMMMESVATVADLTNTSTLPPGRMVEGKMIYVRATKATYQRLNDPPGAGTIADWRIVIAAP